jgi:hypothetical protein
MKLVSRVCDKCPISVRLESCVLMLGIFILAHSAMRLSELKAVLVVLIFFKI